MQSCSKVNYSIYHYKNIPLWAEDAGENCIAKYCILDFIKHTITPFHHPIIQALDFHMKRSYEFPSRKAGQLTILIGLGLIFLLQNILSLRYFLRDTMITDSLTRARQEMKICICLADDRYTDTDMQLDNIKSLQELHQYARGLSENSSNLDTGRNRPWWIVLMQ